MTIYELLKCYNVAKEEYDEEDTRNVQMPKTKGEQAIEGLDIESITYTQPINTWKVKLWMIENPKFAQIRNYWSEETVEKIVELLREYHDLFPMNFS
jgi:hypothetical protein